MSILHIAFYPSDWLAGTRGLSAEETGVYITLIARMYEMAGPIERDDDRLTRLCGCKSKRSFVRCLEYLIAEGKIVENGGELSNDRAQKEIEKTTIKSSKARDAAQSRWSKKSNKNNGRQNADASPKHMPQRCQLEPEPDKKKDTNVSFQKKRGTRLPDDWVLPREWGEWALAEGWPEQVIRDQAERFRDYWISKTGQTATKRDWSATWRNWMRNSKAPKVLTGGHDDQGNRHSERLQRIIAAAAGGTSGKDWG